MSHQMVGFSGELASSPLVADTYLGLYNLTNLYNYFKLHFTKCFFSVADAVSSPFQCNVTTMWFRENKHYICFN